MYSAAAIDRNPKLSPPEFRLNISGSLLPDPDIYHTIEKLGGNVVSDDLPTVVRLLEDIGIPVLCLDVERRPGRAQIETRLEAFREILAARDRS